MLILFFFFSVCALPIRFKWARISCLLTSHPPIKCCHLSALRIQEYWRWYYCNLKQDNTLKIFGDIQDLVFRIYFSWLIWNLAATSWKRFFLRCFFTTVSLVVKFSYNQASKRVCFALSKASKVAVTRHFD